MEKLSLNNIKWNVNAKWKNVLLKVLDNLNVLAVASKLKQKCSTLEITVDQLHLKDNWKTYIKHFTKPIFLIAMSLIKDSITDAVTWKNIYACNSILKGSHHRHFLGNILTIKWFQMSCNIANFQSFLIMSSC